MLFGLAFASWGIGKEGIEPSVSGHGKVSVPGATADDVAFLQDHTGHPGVWTLVLGVVIAIAGALGWWRTEMRTVGAVVAALGGLGAMIWAIITVSGPERRLFDASVNDALDAGSSVLQPGWGLLGTLAVAIVVMAAAAWSLVRR
ncbi:hypothetical protein GOEFS_068_00050 [Gordonia effusa NBRC 100432]|uniref:Uncharacterized protein n=1 Tax=Gordonia effusa NBRC 100432 TaxID=1077974 RepID=H0R1A9_9ACTN|nr:hypothetical protein GOEFS_068_00050 [Gordonia effusa NBRC 100432]